jgi:hypothetical protein
MINLKFGDAAWSIGTPYDESDIWTDAGISATQWSQELRDYDYVVLYANSESFNEEFSTIFESGTVEPGNVYQVIKNPEGVSLVKVT